MNAPPKESEIIARAITEAVVDQFKDWLQDYGSIGPELKADIYNRVLKILQHIERIHKLIKSKVWEANRLRNEGTAWIKSANQQNLTMESAEMLRMNGKTALDNADALNRQAENLEHRTLHKLGVKLAQMRTDIMPFLPDRSIVR